MSRVIRRTCFILAAVVVSGAGQAAPRDALAVQSPDGKLRLEFTCATNSAPTYTFTAEGRPLINTSPLGVGWIGKPEFVKSSTRSVRTVWKPLWGKRTIVPEEFNELTLDLKAYRLVARAYDNGVAFRYELPEGKATVELTQFAFAGDYTAWFYNGENHNLGPEKLSNSDSNRRPVMTIKVDESCYMAIHEADLPWGEPLVLQGKKSNTTFSVVSRPSPAWRVILYGHSPGALVDSHLIELLNPPPADGMDFSWVKPGLAVWDWRINGAQVEGFKYTMALPSWLRMVDFASENGIRYLVLDADWYGKEFAKESNPTKGGYAGDARKLIDYAKTKNVGIWLYLNDVAGRAYPIDQTLKAYGEWGAAGVKYGFMKASTAEKNTRTRMITELCARNKLLCDFHDGPTHPYGQMRTWPNAVTREFCQAQSDGRKVFKPKTFVTSVFVNMLAGPLDMNNGMFDLRQGRTTRVDNPQEVPSTLVAEAARTLIVFSGATIIPDIPEFYRKYPDLLAFLAAQQMPWRESRTLSGVIGEHIVMARQAADGAWLIGAATDESARELDIRLDFLPSGSYSATITQDGPDGDYLKNRETLRTEKHTVSPSDSIHVRLAPGGGACVILNKLTSWLIDSSDPNR